MTLRSHTAPITSLTHSPSRRLLYSTSLDATIRVWQLPPASRTTYATFETSTGVPVATFVGHTDAVWDCVLVKNESVLVTCGADGKVKVWDVSPSAMTPNADGEVLGKLINQWGFNGTEAEGEETNGIAIGATSVASVKTDLRLIAVAFNNSVVKIFDLESGKETAKLASDASYGESEPYYEVCMF